MPATVTDPGVVLAGRAPPTSRETSPFRADIEGLRALAVAMVVTYHVWLGRVSGGVDVFLLVSAFLLTGGLLRRVERGEPLALVSHWLRTFQRLVPAAAVVIVSTVFAGRLLLPAPRWGDLLRDAVGSLTYTENWVLAGRAVDYYADKGGASPLQHFWSLAIQGQVFILWPVVIAVAVALAGRRGRHGRRAPTAVVALVFGVVFALSLAWSVHSTGTQQAYAYFDSRARLWEFALGSLLAVAVASVRLPSVVAVPLGWVGVAGMLACGLLLDVTASFPGAVALWPLSCAAAVLLAGVVPTRWGVSTVLGSRPFVALGGVAYALYLVHWPLLVLWLAVSGRQRAGLLDGAVIVVGAVVLAAALTRLVERPLRSLDWPRSAPWRSAGLVLGTIAALTTLALAGILDVGREAQRAAAVAAGTVVPDYPGARSVQTGATAAEVPADRRLPSATALRAEFASLPQRCSGEWAGTGPLAEVCSAAEPAGPAASTVLVVGDSHAEQWLAALEPIARQHDWRLVALLEGGCSFGDPTTRSGGCTEFNAAARNYLQGHRVDLLVTVSTAAHPTTGAERLVTGYGQAVAHATSSGIPVLGIRDNPRYPSGVVSCALERGDQACTPRATDKLAAQDPAAALDGTPGFSRVDLSDLICPDGACPPSVGNVWVYLDDNHLTKTYAATLSSALEQRMRDAGAWPQAGTGPPAVGEDPTTLAR